MIRVVSDTPSNLPQDIMDEYKIPLVASYLSFGNKTLKDRFEISTSEFYERLPREAELPVASQPTVQDFTTVYEQVLKETPDAEILSIHISGVLSGVIESARQAAAAMPNAKIRIFDTLTLSLGEALMVREAARMAREGAEVPAIIARLEAMRDSAALYTAMDTLDYLAKSGRIGRAARLMGTLLGMKPVIAIRKGAAEGEGRYSSRERAIDHLRTLATNARQGKNEFHLGVFHTACEEEALRFKEEMTAKLNPSVVLFGEIGPAVGVHTGPGAIGLCWCAPS